MNVVSDEFDDDIDRIKTSQYLNLLSIQSILLDF